MVINLMMSQQTSREIPLIRSHGDARIEIHSIPAFCSFRNVASYEGHSQLTKVTIAYDTIRNESLSSYCAPVLKHKCHFLFLN